MKLRELREACGMTQREAAKALHVRPPTLCGCEKGVRKPSVDMLPSWRISTGSPWTPSTGGTRLVLPAKFILPRKRRSLPCRRDTGISTKSPVRREV